MLFAPPADPPPVSQPAPKLSVITSPDWVTRPSGEDIAELYPKAAMAKNLEGRATIGCKVLVTGQLVGCTVVEEAPADAGFGAAALAMSAKFKMKPQTKDGQPVEGGTVRIPIRFTLPKGPPDLATATRCYGTAAATAERNPTADAWSNVVIWNMVVAYHMATAERRPSELEKVLADAHKAAAARTPTQDASDRTECQAARPDMR
ncbi:MAG: energy transducer TonB [Phenylobacterium sp.]